MRAGNDCLPSFAGPCHTRLLFTVAAARRDQEKNSSAQIFIVENKIWFAVRADMAHADDMNTQWAFLKSVPAFTGAVPRWLAKRACHRV